MKNFGLKIACIFIILMYCLAPLSALDLNQDDNNKYIKHDTGDSSINTKDVDVANEQKDRQDKSLDDADSVETKDIDNNVDGKNQDVEKTTGDKNLQSDKRSPHLRIHIKNIHLGERATAEIYANNFFTGTVKVYLEDSDVPYSVSVKNGYGKVTFNKVFREGTYFATVKYSGDLKYKPDQSSTRFKVSKAHPNLSIKVNDVNIGEKATAEITADKSFRGTVYVYLKGSPLPYSVYVKDGYGKVSFKKPLPAGRYVATVKYAGNYKYQADKSSTTFYVNKIDPNLSIKVDDINCGEKATVKISADKAFTGYVYVSFHGDLMPQKVFVKKGYAQETIDEDLNAGTYTATVKYAGDRKFNPSEDSTSFTVKANIDPNLTIKVDDITEGQKVVAVVTANETVNGEANVKLDRSNAVYPINIVDGYATVTLDENLAPGDYRAIVTFFGDDIFKASKSSTTFNVKEKAPELIDPNLNIKVKDIAYGDKASVTITTNANFTGNVNVNIGANSYYVKVVNGQGTISVSGLNVGTYTAKATFKQTETFNASTKTTKFTVKKANPKITANSKTFKYSQKIKPYSVSLKDNKGKAMQGKSIVLKVNGKTYRAKTNNKGVATFKITNLNKVGCKNAVITYAGDKNYNKVSRKARITVKFDAITTNSKNKLMVKKIQRALKRNHFYIKFKGHNLLVDGLYHFYTKWAVKKYQKSKGLKVTGKVDYLTALKLKLI